MSTHQLIPARKMSREGGNAETKFWRMPELVEMLLPLLDPLSVINLGNLHHPSLELIQRSIVWNKLLRNTIPDNKDAYWEDEGEEEVDREDMLGTVWQLAWLTESFEDPKPFQLDLLHLICERNPPNGRSGLIDVVCCCNQTHSVTPLGFLLLEEVESELGSTMQSVERVQVHNILQELEFRSPALTERVIRQQRMVSVVNATVISCESRKDAEAFYAITENCQVLFFRTLSIEREIGAEGWAAIRKAFELHERIFPRYDLTSTKQAMAEGRREDLRAIWDNLGLWSSWILVEGGPMHATRLEHWEVLENILDTKEEEAEGGHGED